MILPDLLLTTINYILSNPYYTHLEMSKDELHGIEVGKNHPIYQPVIVVTREEAIEALAAHNRQIRLDFIDDILADLDNQD